MFLTPTAKGIMSKHLKIIDKLNDAANANLKVVAKYDIKQVNLHSRYVDFMKKVNNLKALIENAVFKKYYIIDDRKQECMAEADLCRTMAVKMTKIIEEIV